MEIKIDKISRATITGEMKERNEALKKCQEQGFSVIRSGPKILEGGTKCDDKFFEIVAENITDSDYIID